MSTILTNSVIEWHKIKCFRVDTASLDTFLLRRNTRLAFSPEYSASLHKAYRVGTACCGCIERSLSSASRYTYSD